MLPSIDQIQSHLTTAAQSHMEAANADPSAPHHLKALSIQGLVQGASAFVPVVVSAAQSSGLADAITTAVSSAAMTGSAAPLVALESPVLWGGFAIALYTGVVHSQFPVTPTPSSEDSSGQ